MIEAGNTPKESEKQIESVDKALGILECFSTKTPELSLKQLSEMTGLYKSRILRLCGTLMAHGCLIRLEGSLYRLDADYSVHTMAGGLACSNGLGWSPDNRTMYVTAQFAYQILAFDFDPATGEIANRRVFAQVPEADGLPMA